MCHQALIDTEVLMMMGYPALCRTPSVRLYYKPTSGHATRSTSIGKANGCLVCEPDSWSNQSCRCTCSVVNATHTFHPTQVSLSQVYSSVTPLSNISWFTEHEFCSPVYIHLQTATSGETPKIECKRERMMNREKIYPSPPILPQTKPESAIILTKTQR